MQRGSLQLAGGRGYPTTGGFVMKLGWLSLYVMAITFIGLGLMSLIAPTNLTPLVELTMTTPVAIMEIRGVYGGLFPRIGRFFLLSSRPPTPILPGLVAPACILRGLVL